MSDYRKNIFLIFGTAVGAGIFSLPIALQQSGALVFFPLLVLLGYIMMRINTFYYELVAHFRVKHQFPGYVELIMGEQWGRIALYLMLFSIYGALIAYSFLGGTFLSQLLSISEDLGRQLFYALGVVVFLFAGSKLESIDISLTVLKGAVFTVLIALMGFEVIQLLAGEGIKALSLPPLIGGQPYLAFGVILFSFASVSIIAELHGKKEAGKKAITIAQVYIGALYALFSLVGVLYGLHMLESNPALLHRYGFLNTLFQIGGFITVFTPFQFLALAGRDMLMRDLSVSERSAKGWIAFVPFMFILFQFGTFLKILSITGGIFLAAMAYLVTWCYAMVFPDKHRGELVLIRRILTIGILSEIIIIFL